jgi:hypothetical protein
MLKSQRQRKAAGELIHYFMATFPRELWAMFVDCPADEIGSCYFYEFSRENESLRDLCAKHRPAIPPDVADGFEYYLSSPWSADQGELIADPARAFMLWPEWPDKPYLRIPADERRKRLRWSAKDDPKLAHLKKLSFSAMSQISPEGLRPVSPAGATPPSGEAWSEALAFSQGKLGWPVHQINPSMWETVFRIDWKAFSDTHLVDMFKAWLGQYRPIPATSLTENPSVTNRFETHLKQLGALRVLRKFTMDEIPAGISLYRDKSEWARSKLVAQGVIEWFSV